MKNNFTCIHYISKFLPITEVWMYNQVRFIKNFKPVVISRSGTNSNLFPFEPKYSLKENGDFTYWLNIFISRLIGYIPYFYLVCKKENVKILHVHFGYNGIKFINLKKVLRVPMVCSFYGTDAFSFPFKRKSNLKKLKKLFINADKILVLGPYMKKSLIELGCPAEKIIIHHLGIEVRKIRFKKRQLPVNRPIRFLVASSFVEKKGIDICLKALAQVINLFDFHVDIIGDGVLRDVIKSIITDLNMLNYVTLHGYKDYKYMINLAYSCDIFLQASRTTNQNDKEGTPMVFVDMMATGMPVISTKHSDIPEIIDDQINGYLAEENSIDSFKTKILKLINNKEYIPTMSENCREKVVKKFNAETQSIRLEKIYQSLI